MCNNQEIHNHPGEALACAICGGKFGLIRYYSCRRALCSRKCLERSRERRQRDHQWLFHADAAGRLNRLIQSAHQI
jgi:hypothetical protein